MTEQGSSDAVEWFGTLRTFAQAIATSATERAVANAVLDAAHALLTLHASAVFVSEPEAENAGVLAARGLDLGQDEAELPCSSLPDSVRLALGSGEAIWLGPFTPRADSGVLRAALPAGLWLTLPLHSGDGRRAFLFAAVEEPADAAAGARDLLLTVAEMGAQGLARVRLAEKNEQLRCIVAEASRCRDEFLATLSHELRTPLNAVLGWAAILNAHPNDTPTVHKGLAAIERNARNQARIVEDVLDVAAIVAGTFRLEVQPGSFSAAVLETVQTISPMAEAKGVALVMNLEDGPFTLVGDQPRLKRAIGQIASNAVKFTPAGGRISITLSRTGVALVLTVVDTGPGIPRKFLPRLFGRFEQADSTTTRAHGGLGLGLSIARHVVTLHGGTIEAKNGSSGRGAEFTIRLPLEGSTLRRGRSGEVLAPERFEARVYPERRQGAARGARDERRSIAKRTEP